MKGTMDGKQVLCRTELTGRNAADSELVLGEFKQAAATWLPRYAEQVQMIYLDPPFYTGRQFSRRIHLENKVVTTGTYEDQFESMDQYEEMMRQALIISRQLLRKEGVLFLHVDYRTSARMRLLLDEIFGEERFINEIIWAFESGGRSKNHFSRKHNTIFMYGKSASYFFDLSAVPCGTRTDGRHNHMRRQTDEQGRTYRSIRSGGKEYRYYEDEPVYPSDVWTDISHLQQRDPERAGFETQKPLRLLQRMISSSSRRRDIVADLFAGSGTTGVAASGLGRRFLMCDRTEIAVSLADTRLAEAEASYTVRADSVLDGSTLNADVCRTETDTAIRLRRFLPAGETGNSERELLGLSAWSAGIFEAGIYRRMTGCTGAEELHLNVSREDAGKLAVMTCDYLGNRRCFHLTGESFSG